MDDWLRDEYDEATELVGDNPPPEPTEPVTCVGCKHRWWVKAHPWGSSQSGWGCKLTGGHAIRRCDGYEEEGMEEKITPEYFQQFIGTEHYYAHAFGLLLTDGTKALAEKCSAYWLMDIVASIIPILRGARQPFAVLDLTVNPEEHTGLVVVHNGNSPDHPEDGPYREYHRQEIPYTDFPFGKQKLFISVDPEHCVTYLPSEH